MLTCVKDKVSFSLKLIVQLPVKFCYSYTPIEVREEGKRYENCCIHICLGWKTHVNYSNVPRRLTAKL